jgi:hypothetical protein
MLIARATQTSSFKPVPPGSHLARCYRIIDLGTQKTTFNGESKFIKKVMFQFEVHSEDDDGPLKTDKGEPMSISKNYTLSLSDKAVLRADLEAWRGREFTREELQGFELKNVLGAWCLITVTRATGNDGREYTNITGVSPVPKAMKQNLPTPFNQVGIFYIDDPDMEMFQTLSERIRQKIMETPEWKSRGKSSSAPIEDDESIPF